MSQNFQDISSNLNRIVNFYIRGSELNLHFVNESLELLIPLQKESFEPNISSLLEKTKDFLTNIKNTPKLDYYLADDALTYSTLLSIYARQIQLNQR